MKKKILTIFILIIGLAGTVNADEKLGINYKPTKYQIGDKFHGDFGVWELIEFVPVYKPYPEIFKNVWICRWRIKIHAESQSVDAWSDDHWLDKLAQLIPKTR